MTARYCIMATGCLSSRNTPDFEGLGTYQGEWCHTGEWPQDGVDFTGKRVGVIGTGSSGVQSIPIIAEQADHLHVFQRTPTYSVPANNELVDAATVAKLKAEYATIRKAASEQPFGSLLTSTEALAMDASAEELQETYEASWAKGGLFFLGAFADLLLDPAANETAAAFIRAKILEIVDDPAVAEKLCPKTPVGCKRLCADTGYFETFNRPNVELIDVAEAPIRRITETGIQTEDGHYELDYIVFATGFDAMTGSLLRIDVRGSGGRSIQEKWAEGPKNYLGVSIAGFPNLFHIAGPGSPSVLSNMVPSIEQHVNWIRDCIAYLEAEGVSRIEAEPAFEDEWIGLVNDIAAETVYPTCNSWYLGANIPGKPRVFMPFIGFPEYVARCEEVAKRGYEGFKLSRSGLHSGSAAVGSPV